MVAPVRVGPGLPTAAARRALLARGGSGGRGPGSWARWAPGCPPTRAGKVGCGSLLTIPPLTVITVPDSLPLPLECFSPGLSKAVLCYAVTWGSSCLVVFLRASSSACLPRVAQGDWTGASSGPTPQRGHQHAWAAALCFRWSQSSSATSWGRGGWWWRSQYASVTWQGQPMGTADGHLCIGWGWGEC